MTDCTVTFIVRGDTTPVVDWQYDIVQHASMLAKRHHIALMGGETRFGGGDHVAEFWQAAEDSGGHFLLGDAGER